MTVRPEARRPLPRRPGRRGAGRGSSTARGSTPREARRLDAGRRRRRRSAPSAAASSSTWRSTPRGRCWRAASDAQTLDIPLGPEIGQCCGGRTVLSVDAARRRRLGGAARRGRGRAARRCPRSMIFGAGHVGRALAAALALLPVRAGAGRPARRGAAPGAAGRRRGADAAARGGGARARRPGGAFVVLTHDHALDFLIVARGAGARRRRLCRDDRLEDQAGVVPALAASSRRNRPPIPARSSARSARPGGRTSGPR